MTTLKLVRKRTSDSNPDGSEAIRELTPPASPAKKSKACETLKEKIYESHISVKPGLQVRIPSVDSKYSVTTAKDVRGKVLQVDDSDFEFVVVGRVKEVKLPSQLDVQIFLIPKF